MASNEKGAIIPFGKYKGQPVEILQGDSDYLQWLLAQDWFRTRFASVYNVIINYSGEATETPEHNALQVLFLDDAFCIALLRHLEPDIDQRAMQRLEKDREEDIKWLRTNSYYSDREERQKTTGSNLRSLRPYQVLLPARIRIRSPSRRCSTRRVVLRQQWLLNSAAVIAHRDQTNR
jgi:hypothetical protein